MYDLTANERANKSALLVLQQRYSTKLAPFVKNSKARLTYVESDITKMIEDVCAEVGADEEYVTSRFNDFLAAILAPVLKNPGNAKREPLEQPDRDAPYATNLSPNSEEGREGIVEADPLDRGEVAGAGRAEALEPDARVDLNAETAEEGGPTEVEHVTSALLKEAMTARDFRLIAGILAQTGATPEQVEAFADALASTNAMFDRERFIAAAGGSPMTGRDAPNYRMNSSCFRCGKATEKTASLSPVCAECNEELLKVAYPSNLPGTDTSLGTGAGAPEPGVQEAPTANPNLPYACTLCGREGNADEIRDHINRDHADVLQRQQQLSPDNMGQDNLGVPQQYSSWRIADVPRADDAAQVEPLPENPGDRFDEYVQKLAETAAARKFSQVSDEDIHSIASQLGAAPDDVRNSLICTAVFGENVAVNGELGQDPTPPEGYEEISASGLAGQQPTHDAVVPTDLVVSSVADEMNMSVDLAYNMIKDKYGADLPDKYHASISGQVHYYLPTDLAGNQQPQEDPSQTGPAAPPAPQVQQTPQRPLAPTQ